MLKEEASSVLQDTNTGVKIDPNVKRMRIVVIIVAIAVALQILSVVLQFIGSHGSSFNVFNIAFSLFYIVFLAFYSIFIERYWKKLEQKRQSAARGNQGLLADEQPVANEHALTLPLTIGQRPKWKTFLIIPAIALVAGLAGFFAATHGHPLSLLALLIGIGILLVLLLLYGVLIGVVLYRKVREQITLTENGLMQVGMSSKVKSIPWSEARLFAINGIAGAKNYPRPTVFELSSPNEVIRWAWMRQNNIRVLSFAKPTLSPEEYERTMNGVFSVIAAKTGLPLYDLRKDLPKDEIK